MNDELKTCPFIVHGDYCDDFDGPCARYLGNYCAVYNEIKKRDRRIAELEKQIERARINELKVENWRLLVVAKMLCEWNEKYPTNAIFNESEIRKIAAEMDEIYKVAQEALKGGK